mmetsp:Transcript_2201/g.4084  ORF Transcript_2201/g.4084 Transcript_2201/m.4084 type:complete len:230 (-) Transcript_2201:260-949(-)
MFSRSTALLQVADVRHIDSTSTGCFDIGRRLARSTDAKKRKSCSCSSRSRRIHKRVLRTKSMASRRLPLRSLSSLSCFDGHNSPVPFSDRELSKMITRRARSRVDDPQCTQGWSGRHVRQVKCRLNRSSDSCSNSVSSPDPSPLWLAPVGPSTFLLEDIPSLSFPEDVSECETEIEDISRVAVAPNVQVRVRPANPVGRFLASLDMECIGGEDHSSVGMFVIPRNCDRL